MKRITALAATGLLLATLAACGKNTQPTTGLAAAANCLEDGGATKIMPTDRDEQRNVAAKGPDGGLIFIGASDVDTNMVAARQLRHTAQGEAVTWVTPDRNAVVAIAGNASTRDSHLAMTCGLIMPDNPGKENRKFRAGDARLARTQFNMALVESICDLRPGRVEEVILGDALGRGIGVRRLDGFTARMAVRAAETAPNKDGVTCKSFREWDL